MHFSTKSALYSVTSTETYSSPCTALAELNQTAASVSHMLTGMCDVPTLTPTAVQCKMTFAGMKVHDGRRWQASGLFQSSQTCCENDDRWHVEGAPCAVKSCPKSTTCWQLMWFIHYPGILWSACMRIKERGGAKQINICLCAHFSWLTPWESCVNI